MKKFWKSLFELNEERSIWIEQENLGEEKSIEINHKRYFVKIPPNITNHLTLRLKGLGKTRLKKSGDFFLHLWLNHGEDVRKNLWISETAARNGADKKLWTGEKPVTLVVPPRSYNGLTIRLKEYGKKANFGEGAPLLERKTGNLMVKLFVFPDSIAPKYVSFDALSTEDMFLEGWIYRKIDLVFKKIVSSSFPDDPLRAEMVADAFNESGWMGVYEILRAHLKLTYAGILVKKSRSINKPGMCQKSVTSSDGSNRVTRYTITINEEFLENPFLVAAILAHELCHVVCSEKIDDPPANAATRQNTEQISLEEERTVDLLVFMFKIGEFQMRVARDKNLTLGYFNQDVFERMQAIVVKKLDSLRRKQE